MSRKIMQFHDEKNKADSSTNDGKVILTCYRDREIALLIKDHRLLSVFVIETESKVGAIYIGKVKNVVKNLDACFVEIDNGEITYLPLSEVKYPLLLNREYDGRIMQGDEILVQVQKDAIKTKQSSVTAQICIQSDYFVFTLDEATIGVSNKLNKILREQIKKELIEYKSDFIDENPKDNFQYSCIVRTEAGKLFEENHEAFFEIYSYEMLAFLQLIKHSMHKTCYSCVKAPLKPYEGILKRFNINEYSEVITDLPEAYTSLQSKGWNVRYYNDDFSLLKLYSLESKIEEALQKKVWLPCGGYLIIEQTECLTTIDVNSGKMINGTEKEATIRKINEEAAKEASIQIRLRNLSGIIIIDFINMQEKSDELSLIQYMKENIKADPVSTNVIDITPLGLMEVTRKKMHKSLKEQFDM